MKGFINWCRKKAMIVDVSARFLMGLGNNVFLSNLQPGLKGVQLLNLESNSDSFPGALNEPDHL